MISNTVMAKIIIIVINYNDSVFLYSLAAISIIIGLSTIYCIITLADLFILLTSQPSPQSRTYTCKHTLTYIHTHRPLTYTQRRWEHFSTSREAHSAMLPFYRRSALIHRHNNLSLFVARYPFYTWVGLDNSCKLPFPRVNKVRKASFEPRTFTLKRDSLSTQPLRRKD